MARKRRYMDTSKGYSRAAQKAVTMAVVEEDYYEELLDAEAGGVELFRVSDEERAAGEAASPPPAERAAEPPATKPKAPRKKGLLGRVFSALRRSEG